MSSSNGKSSQNKARLGRGLGSLLSVSANDFEPEAKPEIISVSPPTPKIEAKNNDSLKEPAPVVTAKPGSAPEKKTVEVDHNNTEVVEKTSVVTEKTSNQSDLSMTNRVWSLAIEKIVPNSTQPRKDFLKEPLDELAQSIRSQGVLQPITVRQIDGKYEIIAGERRWRASQLAGLTEIPAIVKNVDDQKAMELAMIENLQREDLNALEEALGYQLLIDEYNLTQQVVADKVGKNRATVTNALRLLVLPRDVKEMLRQGVLSVGHAKVLLSLEDSQAQVKLARKVASKKLSVRALESEVKKQDRDRLERTDSTLSAKERSIKSLSDELQKLLGTKVQILYRQGRGKVEVSFYSDEELNSLIYKMRKTQPTMGK